VDFWGEFEREKDICHRSAPEKNKILGADQGFLPRIKPNPPNNLYI